MTQVTKFELKYVPLEKLYFDPTGKYNPARTNGQPIDGIAVKDSRDLQGMADSIVERGGIEKPLMALEASPLTPAEFGKSLFGFGGFRRHGGAELLTSNGEMKAVEQYGDAEKVKSVFESFKRIPVQVFKSTGTVEGDTAFILSFGNDQDQRQYSVSGLFNLVWMLFSSGKSFTDIVEMVGEQVANLTPTGRSKMAAIRALKTPKERLDATRKLLKGRLDDEWLAVCKLGNRVRKAYFIELLRQDNLTDDVPEIKLGRGEIRELMQAKAEDGVNWHPERGGEIFDNKVNALIEAQKNPEKKNGSTKPSAEKIKTLIEGAKSKATRSAMQFINGVEGATEEALKSSDEAAYRLELITATWLKVRTDIKDGPVKALLNYVLGNGDPLTVDSEFAKLA